MPELVADCPRCGANRMTFDLKDATIVSQQYGWQHWYESFCVCRGCHRSSIFVLSEKVGSDWQYLHKKGLLNLDQAANNFVAVEGNITLKDEATVSPPEHVPNEIKAVFAEGATCQAVACYNAAGTMFRLCVDMATRSLLPAGEAEGLNAKVRRDLGLRLPWLFAKGLLPEALKELSACIKEDGNDGAHAGTLGKEEAEDLLDFTVALLERMYTEPTRLRLAKERRDERRAKGK